jgi:hypothetical protein
LTREPFLNINKVMAIRRCPYCKAIIDEGSEYCSNCGTQLLFPEDEYIHEETPGEKIVEEETPEEEQQDLGSFEAEGEEELKQGEEVEGEAEEKPAEEETAVEMHEEAEIEDVEKSHVEEIVEEPQIEKKPPDEGKPAEEERDEYFVEKQEPEFGTEDLEKIIDPEEKEKAEIEKFLKSLKENRDEWDGEIPPTDELPPWAEKIKDEQPSDMPVADAGSEEVVQEPEEPQEGIAEEEGPVVEEPTVEEAPVAEEEVKEVEEEILKPMGVTPEDEVPEVKVPEEDVVEEEFIQVKPAEEEMTEEKMLEEEKSEEEAAMPDTGMGLPEGVEQEKLPFSEKASVLFKDQEKSPSSKLSTWLKSRAFDVLFIAALWIVTLHIASRMLSTNLFKLISVSAFPVFAFYLALLAAYLFLFFVFLGQTLGDHLFPYEE